MTDIGTLAARTMGSALFVTRTNRGVSLYEIAKATNMRIENLKNVEVGKGNSTSLLNYLSYAETFWKDDKELAKLLDWHSLLAFLNKAPSDAAIAVDNYANALSEGKSENEVLVLKNSLLEMLNGYLSSLLVFPDTYNYFCDIRSSDYDRLRDKGLNYESYLAYRLNLLMELIFKGKPKNGFPYSLLRIVLESVLVPHQEVNLPTFITYRQLEKLEQCMDIVATEGYIDYETHFLILSEYYASFDLNLMPIDKIGCDLRIAISCYECGMIEWSEIGNLFCRCFTNKPWSVGDVREKIPGESLIRFGIYLPWEFEKYDNIDTSSANKVLTSPPPPYKGFVYTDKGFVPEAEVKNWMMCPKPVSSKYQTIRSYLASTRD